MSGRGGLSRWFFIFFICVFATMCTITLLVGLGFLGFEFIGFESLVFEIFSVFLQS